MSVVFTSLQNGTNVHYIDNVNNPCHPAIVAGNWTSSDEPENELETADIIQLDNEVNNVIVPLRRNACVYDATVLNNNTWHQSCNRYEPE